MNARVGNIVAELRWELALLYADRLVAVVVFGSQARGDAAAGSDIDVLVVLRGTVQPGTEIRRTGTLRSRLCLKYGEVVSTTFISAERFESEKSPLLLNVRREGVTV